MEKNQSNIEFLSDKLPATVKNEIVVARTAINEDHPDGMLTPDEEAKYNTFTSAGRRREYLSTRWLIAEMNRKRGGNPSSFTLKKDEFGKPFGLMNGRNVYISIAHTDAHVLCAISDKRAVGVDLEPADRTVSDRLRERMLHAREHEMLLNCPTIRIWTIKEALVKLQGKGMRINLNECMIDGWEEEIFSALINNEKTAKICSFRHQNHWLAIAWNY